MDTTNKLFTRSLQAGDMFVFPKGLVHFQYNIDANNPALAVSAFGSANAGTVTSQDSICPLNLHGHNTKYKTRVATYMFTCIYSNILDSFIYLN